MTSGSIDKRHARRSFERAASRYDEAAELQREIADRMIERLDYVRLDPGRVLDLGSGTGYALDPLRRRFGKAGVIALDFAHSMLVEVRKRGRWLRRPRCICADAESLPLADGCIDLIFSNATLQWCNDPQATFREFARVLSPGGLLLFSTFGPDTLKELRAAWSQADGYSHVSRFPDMHDVGDDLMRAGFLDPVMDAERLTLTYSKAADLMRDLKLIGARNATAGRPRGLTGRRRHKTMEQAYETYREEGRLPATYEVVYGLAWAPVQRQVADGIAVPVSAIGRGPRR